MDMRRSSCRQSITNYSAAPEQTVDRLLPSARHAAAVAHNVSQATPPLQSGPSHPQHSAMGNSSSSSGDDDGRGSEGSGSVPQDQAPREDEADGDSDIHEEEDEEQDHDRSDVPDEERGFNMVFSPELVRRLQGEPEPGEDDDGTPGTAGSSGSSATQNNLAEAGIAAQLAEAERVERERREAERRHFAALSRQEKVAAAELEGILRSIPSEADLAAAREQQQEQQRQKRGRHVPPPSFEGPCAEEQAACMECIRAEGSIPECQDVINKFEACAARR